MSEIIAIGADHAGFELKEKLKEYLSTKGFDIKDFGCFSSDSIDYPDYAHPVAKYVEENNSRGILLCGSGNGISMTANKHQNIRAAICWTPEIAKLARLHNDANIVVFPARFIDDNTALEILEQFLNTEFEGGRHFNRIQKIPCN